MSRSATNLLSVTNLLSLIMHGAYGVFGRDAEMDTIWLRSIRRKDTWYRLLPAWIRAGLSQYTMVDGNLQKYSRDGNTHTVLFTFVSTITWGFILCCAAIPYYGRYVSKEGALVEDLLMDIKM